MYVIGLLCVTWYAMQSLLSTIKFFVSRTPEPDTALTLFCTRFWGEESKLDNEMKSVCVCRSNTTCAIPSVWRKRQQRLWRNVLKWVQLISFSCFVFSLYLCISHAFHSSYQQTSLKIFNQWSWHLYVSFSLWSKIQDLGHTLHANYE